MLIAALAFMLRRSRE